MPDSVHAARWINQVSGRGWDVHLFSAYEAPPHPDLRNVTVYNFSSARPAGLHGSVRLRGLWPLRRGAARLAHEARSRFPHWSERSTWLAQVVRRIKPDIVHSQEIQHAGYLTLAAKQKFKGQFPPWIVANWGSDIYLFGRLADHVEKIKAVLAACDYYHCECHRDVGLAREFGFKGEALPVCPVSGGFDLAWMKQFRGTEPTSARRVIALKGYQNWAGRALVGLRALQLCADALKGYRVMIHMATPEVMLAAELAAQSIGIPFEVDPVINRKMKRPDILRMHGSARISIGLSISDAISTSLLEAMIMGAFPVQSNTGCGDEWLKHGETGLLVPPEDPETVAVAIRRAIADDQLVDDAAEANAQLAARRLDSSVIEPQVLAMYKKVCA